MAKVSVYTHTDNQGTRQRVRPDYADQQHFKRWCEGRRLRLDTRTALWKTFSEDPDFWGNKGWTAVLDHVSQTDLGKAILSAGPL